MELVVSNKLGEYQQLSNFFKIIGLIALGLFVFGLPRKMLGVEVLSCCQMTFLSLCLYQKPLLLYTSMKGMNPVSGGWSLFAEDYETDLLPGFTDRVNISPLFL